MSNQKAKSKVRLGGFVPANLHRQVLAKAQLEGKADNIPAFLGGLVGDALLRREKECRPARQRG
jgi:hypothetical protein